LEFQEERKGKGQEKRRVTEKKETCMTMGTKDRKKEIQKGTGGWASAIPRIVRRNGKIQIERYRKREKEEYVKICPPGGFGFWRNSKIAAYFKHEGRRKNPKGGRSRGGWDSRNETEEGF